MAKRNHDEDLFESTKMTFGEHLEELRKCFFKAGFGLAIGMAIGLYFGFDVVKFIQMPLESALEEYYREQAADNIEEYANEFLGGTENVPPDILARLERGKELFEIYLWERNDVLRGLDLPADPPTEYPSEVGTDEDARAEYRDDMKLLPLEPVLIWRPVEDDPRIKLKSLASQETFVIWLKAGFVFGAIISSPWVFYQVWAFVAAGLYPHEKHYVFIFLPFSLGLFFVGAALAFFVVFGFVLEFLLDFNAGMGIDPDPRISEWLSFVIMLPLGFGLAFQLPLVMLFLQRIGIMSIEIYLGKWRIAVLVMACLAAVLSPGGDPYSMLFMFVPLVGLFFLGIALCKYMPRKTDTDEEMIKSME